MYEGFPTGTPPSEGGRALPTSKKKEKNKVFGPGGVTVAFFAWGRERNVTRSRQQEKRKGRGYNSGIAYLRGGHSLLREKERGEITRRAQKGEERADQCRGARRSLNIPRERENEERIEPRQADEEEFAFRRSQGGTSSSFSEGREEEGGKKRYSLPLWVISGREEGIIKGGSKA